MVINATDNSGSAVSPLLIGWFRDITGRFNSGLYFVSALLIAGDMLVWRI